MPRLLPARVPHRDTAAPPSQPPTPPMSQPPPPPPASGRHPPPSPLTAGRRRPPHDATYDRQPPATHPANAAARLPPLRPRIHPWSRTQADQGYARGIARCSPRPSAPPAAHRRVTRGPDGGACFGRAVASLVQMLTILSTFSARRLFHDIQCIHMERGEHEEYDGDVLFLIACVDSDL